MFKKSKGSFYFRPFSFADLRRISVFYRNSANVCGRKSISQIRKNKLKSAIFGFAVLRTDLRKCPALVIEVAKLLQVELTPDQISTSHRLPTKRKQSSNEQHPSPPIIVRFISRDIRNRIYGLCKLTRNVDLESFSVEGTQRLFINENLTYHRKQLFWKIKQKAKNAGYRFFWTTNGNTVCSCVQQKTRKLLKLILKTICFLLSERIIVYCNFLLKLFTVISC